MTLDLSELRSKREVKKKEAKNEVVVQVGTEEGGRMRSRQVLTCAVGYEKVESKSVQMKKNASVVGCRW